MKHAKLLLSLWLLSSAALAHDDLATSPVPQLKPGTAKLVSIDSLDPALKSVVERDLTLARQPTQAGQAVVENVSDDAAFIFHHYASHAVDWQEKKLLANLKRPWSEVQHTELAQYRYLAFIPEGPSKSGPWSNYTRVFKRLDGALVMLHEWDYAADGGSVLMIKELMNRQVAGLPARLIKRRTHSGIFFTELTWATEAKSFTLTV